MNKPLSRFQIVNRAEKCSIHAPQVAAIATCTDDRWTVLVVRFIDSEWREAFSLVDADCDDAAEVGDYSRFPVFQQAFAHQSSDDQSACLSLLGQSGKDYFAAVLRFDESGLVGDLSCRSAKSAAPARLVWPLANAGLTCHEDHPTTGSTFRDMSNEFTLQAVIPATIQSSNDHRRLWLIAPDDSDADSSLRVVFEFALCSGPCTS